MLYNAVYRCQMCNTTFKANQEAFEADQNTITNLTMKVIQNQQLAGNPYLHLAPMYIIHNCNKGDTGVAQFIGFEQCKHKNKRRAFNIKK